MSAKQGELTDELSRVKSHYGAGATMSVDLKSVTDACERPTKRAKMTSSCREPTTTPSTAAFLALLAKRIYPKNRCEALARESQCIPDLVNEAKELQGEVGRL